MWRGGSRERRRWTRAPIAIGGRRRGGRDGGMGARRRGPRCCRNSRRGKWRWWHWRARVGDLGGKDALKLGAQLCGHA
eukprot:scaffold45043_cov63-Phaeocystis_antarctica.AAC.5